MNRNTRDESVSARLRSRSSTATSDGRNRCQSLDRSASRSIPSTSDRHEVDGCLGRYVLRQDLGERNHVDGDLLRDLNPLRGGDEHQQSRRRACCSSPTRRRSSDGSCGAKNRRRPRARRRPAGRSEAALPSTGLVRCRCHRNPRGASTAVFDANVAWNAPTSMYMPCAGRRPLRSRMASAMTS